MDVLHGLTSDYSHGRGYSEVFPITSPAVAVGFTYNVTGQFWERVAGLSFVLTSDGNAANRSVLLTVKDGTGAAIDAIPPAAVQVASKVYTYTYAPNATPVNDTLGLVNQQRSPSMFLQPLYSLVVTLTAAQAGDQISAIRLYRERFDTGPAGPPTAMVTETALASSGERLGD